MPRKLHIPSAWLLAGLFGAVSLFGQGLHLLPGLDHCLHCHGSHGAVIEGADNPRGNLCGCSAADCDGQKCAICQFMSQGNVLTRSVEPPPQATPQADVAVATPILVLPAQHWAFQSRAPPSSAI
jgi:hypothetical protein